MASKIRLNDEIIVLTGKDKGKRGKIKNILPNGKAIVNGINLIKKHQKPLPAANKLGGIFEKEMAIELSNVGIFDISTNKAGRVGFKIENGKKFRIFKSSGKIIK
ncbi:50S ribosomal protein L24 [Sodalis sp. CWE]|uniref:50S ribosomal protein L24 n=1 Tax=Sodalis sp. CWE TaxID=2803816 RepID=UPI001C7CECB6|nr:50S ribosomal protein L24 [Sodalis sp. CWE]MBX4180751.1 50S ribosomal protein L24 [Sodalis sp. CWE]